MSNTAATSAIPIRIGHTLPLLIIFLTIQAFSWMSESNLPSLTAAPYRVVSAGLLIFFAPGLLLTQIFGLRQMPWQVILAVSSALSMSFAAALLPVPFLLSASIKVYVGLYLIVLLCLCGFVIFQLRCRTSSAISQREPPALLEGISCTDVFHFSVIVLMATAAYGFGENIWNIGGEKLQHLQFIRLYFEMPAKLSALGVLPNMTPPNMVFFWEYLVAAWAAAIHTDPLPVFEHVRFIIPLLGLPSMYFLVWVMFSTRRANQCFSVILLLVLGNLFLVPPTSLSFANATEPSRGVMSFYGTAHHADPAMDILLPMLTALLWLSLSSRRWLWRILLIGMLVVAFLWHPREYFQLAISFPIVVLAFLLNRRSRPAIVIKRAFLLGIGIALIGIIFFAHIKLSSAVNDGYDEWLIKKEALLAMASSQFLFGFRDAFTFPTHFMLSSTINPDKILSIKELITHLNKEFRQEAWLLLAGVAQLILVTMGTRRARTVATAHMIFWGLLLWNAACAFAIAASYSEILMTTPRLLYIFSYIVIAESLLVLAQNSINMADRRLSIPAYMRGAFPIIGFSILGLFFNYRHQWMSESLMRGMSSVLGFGIIGGLLFVALNRPGLIQKIGIKSRHSAFMVVVSSAFLLPAFWPEYLRATQLFLVQPWISSSDASRGITTTTKTLMLTPKRPEVPLINKRAEWFSESNPFNLSLGLVSAVKSLPLGTIITASPVDKPFFSVYAPVYTFPSPLGIIFFVHEHESIKLGTHPIFGVGLPELGSILPYLRKNNIEYVVVQRSNFARLGTFFLSHPESFSTVFIDSARQELLMKVQ